MRERHPLIPTLRRHANQVPAAVELAVLINMKRSTQYIIAAGIIAAAVGYMIAQQAQSTSAITAQETYKKLNDTSVVVLDVRTEQEHAQERIAETPLIPVQELSERVNELFQYKNKTIIVYCRSGNRSGAATNILRDHGFNAVNMSGGILRWKAEQLPTIKGDAQ